MSIRAFSISNFKAFGASSQRMPLKPITLIFGANSAGKSSLLHGYLWSIESFSNGSFDVRTSKRVSGHLDLGGFRSVIRGHATNRKIALAFECEASPHVGTISVQYEIGFMSEVDFEGEHKRLLSEHPDLQEFIESKRTCDEVASRFKMLSHQRFSTDAEIEAALESEESWAEFLVPYHAELDERQAEEPDHDWDRWRENRSVSEMRKLFREGQAAWSQARQLFQGGSVPRLLEVWNQQEERKRSEEGRLSVISMRLVSDGKLVLKAARRPGSGQLEISADSIDLKFWRSFHTTVSPSLVGTTSNGITMETTFPSGWTIVCRGEPNVPDLIPVVREHVFPWLAEHRCDVEGLANALTYVGPLRSLPARRGLVGHPGEPPDDDLLWPWFRLRDDERLQAKVNVALRTLTNSNLSFRRAVYASADDIIETEASMPARSSIHDLAGERPKATRWEESGLMEGFVERAADFMPPDPEGPFYEEFKGDDPKAARALLEDRLVRELPHKVLVDLKIVDEACDVRLTFQDLGVGISQIAPVLVQVLGSKNRTIAIEQPEIHIHPALQAELADVFIESALGENRNTLLLETHSEHLILRLLRRIRETTEGDFSGWSESLRQACPNGIMPEDIAVLYVKPGQEGAEVIELPATADGDFGRPWPGGFFAERSKELF